VAVYYYELHEGDGDVFHDLLLAHDTEFDPETFFELVQEIRERVVDRFEEETLVEAIAAELEREHGFEAVWDRRLTAAVNVSRVAEDNFLAEVDDEDGVDDDGDLRSIVAELRLNRDG
jgi:hypothetical protein